MIYGWFSTKKEQQKFTWNDRKIFNRLEYFLISQQSKLEAVKISVNTVKTDEIGQRVTGHKAIILELKINVSKRGPNHWKMNVSVVNRKKLSA